MHSIGVTEKAVNHGADKTYTQSDYKENEHLGYHFPSLQQTFDQRRPEGLTYAFFAFGIYRTNHADHTESTSLDVSKFLFYECSIVCQPGFSFPDTCN